MSEAGQEIVQQLEKNVTQSVGNEAQRAPSTPEGMIIKCGSVILMALFPVVIGAFRSVSYHKKQKASGGKPATMTHKGAVMFPVIASCTLFGSYVFFKMDIDITGCKDYINLFLTGFFFGWGVLDLTRLMSPVFTLLIPTAVPEISFHLTLNKGECCEEEDLMYYEFTLDDLICMVFSAGVGVWYLLKKHWIANNLFGLAFAVNGIEQFQLNSVITGYILLGGLFFYDIFWVFGTKVMETVAESFEAPIKLVFPQDILVNGFHASNFAMLGLHDIVIPGIFIALLLRFDQSLQRKTNFYFNATFIAYFLGLLAACLVMHVFRHAQPALLYLVPACLGTPLLFALIRGDIKTMFTYKDHPSESEKTTEKND